MKDYLSMEVSTFKQAYIFSEWKDMMHTEYDAFLTINTWPLVLNPSHPNVIDSKRVF